MVKVVLKGGHAAECDVESLKELYYFHRLAHDSRIRIVFWFTLPSGARSEVPTTVLDDKATFGDMYNPEHFKE